MKCRHCQQELDEEYLAADFSEAHDKEAVRVELYCGNCGTYYHAWVNEIQFVEEIEGG
jgi:formate dehydrogenase maturation protein FdhE